MKISEAFRSETFAKKLPLHFPHRLFYHHDQSNHPISTEKNTHRILLLNHHQKITLVFFFPSNQPTLPTSTANHLWPHLPLPPKRPRLFPCGPLRFPVKFNMSRNFAATSWRNWTQKRVVLCMFLLQYIL